MSSGPVPSSLCSLSDLPSQSIGDKIRFLGCITSYDLATATLTLEDTTGRTDNVVAEVDVKLRLESLSAEQTEKGHWLNIIGYITSIEHLGPSARRPGYRVAVQCILHWPAMSVDPVMYERHLRQHSASVDSNPSSHERCYPSAANKAMQLDWVRLRRYSKRDGFRFAFSTAEAEHVGFDPGWAVWREGLKYDKKPGRYRKR